MWDFKYLFHWEEKCSWATFTELFIELLQIKMNFDLFITTVWEDAVYANIWKTIDLTKIIVTTCSVLGEQP